MGAGGKEPGSRLAGWPILGRVGQYLPSMRTMFVVYGWIAGLCAFSQGMFNASNNYIPPGGSG